MTNFEQQSPHLNDVRTDTFYQVVFMFAALSAIFLAFVLANSHFSIEAKTRGFSGIMAGFLLTCVGLHFWQRRQTFTKADASLELEARNKNGLRSLEEANEFFSGSIKAADMFRLVSNRIRIMTPFRSSALFLLDETRSHLRVFETDGPDAEQIKGRTYELNEAPIGICLSKQSVEMENMGKGHVAAIPLLSGVESFGVLCLYFDPENEPGESDIVLFEAIATRVAPLVLSSISLERSLSNAMTDGTTDLPNERAFYLVLENQIAETQRNREMRPLTILALDIKNFDDINKRFGHAAGDRVLSFVSKVIKDNLRQMDFLARAAGDEFLAVLPTASKEISYEVIARISTGFFGRKFKVNERDSVEIEINFGWATFGNDGETPKALLASARERKEQAKSSGQNKVLWFPQELVN